MIRSPFPRIHPVLAIPPLLAFVLVLVLAVWPDSVPWPGGVWFTFLPHAVFLAAGIAGVCFTQTRVLFLAVAMSTTLLSVDRAYFEALDPARGAVALLMGTLFLPVLAAVFYWIQERGVITPYGVTRALVVVFFVAVVVALPVSSGFQQAIMASTPPSYRTDPGVLRIPGISILALLASVPFLCFKRRGESPLLGTLIGMALGFVILSLNFGSSLWSGAEQRPALILFGTLGGFTLLLAVLETAWRHMNIDELTELPGRRPLKHHLRCLGEQYVLAVVDIDHFKRINDTHGHLAGDQMLRYVASELRNNPGGSAYRYGGEEFVMVFENQSYEAALDNLDALRETISRKDFFLRGAARPEKKPRKPQRKTDAPVIHLTVSIGVACPSAHYATPEDVMGAADQALYQAKENGRNRVFHIA